MAAPKDYGKEYGLNFLYSDKVLTLPRIEFPAGDGLFDSEEFPVLVGIDHMDPMFMAANTSSHRENEVIYPLLDFAVKTMK